MKNLLLALMACLLLASCAKEKSFENAPEEDGWHNETLVMNVSLSGYDDGTKAAVSLKDGDVIYLLFTKGNDKVAGRAVYSASSASWTVNYYGSLQRDAKTAVSLWYFDGAGTLAEGTVPLTASTGIYTDEAGSYTYPTDGDLTVTGALAPMLGRIRFKGAVDTEIWLGGIRHYTDLNTVSGALSYNDENVVLKVQQDGYTPFVYGTFADAEKREMRISNGKYLYTAECPSKVLQKGKSGWMDIPTPEACNEWTKKKEDPFNGHEYVDLDLTSGTLWATCNVGASKPEEYGDYFAWGETTGYNSGKTNFEWSTYKWCNGSATTLTKYCFSSSCGTVDNKTELELSDDAARANWGGQWRMPSSAQIDELISECNTEWTTQNSVYGRKVRSKKNGKSIFLPAAGYRDGSSLYSAVSDGIYWLRSLYESDSYYAFDLGFRSSYFVRNYGERFYGRSVRPVVSE